VAGRFPIGSPSGLRRRFPDWLNGGGGPDDDHIEVPPCRLVPDSVSRLPRQLSAVYLTNSDASRPVSMLSTSGRDDLISFMTPAS